MTTEVDPEIGDEFIYKETRQLVSISRIMPNTVWYIFEDGTEDFYGKGCKNKVLDTVPKL